MTRHPATVSTNTLFQNTLFLGLHVGMPTIFVTKTKLELVAKPGLIKIKKRVFS